VIKLCPTNQNITLIPLLSNSKLLYCLPFFFKTSLVFEASLLVVWACW